jgi:undecaprenyl diphosphate synthase
MIGDSPMKSLIDKLYEKKLWRQIQDGKKPHHIGVILDGNRRFARHKNLDISVGHELGGEKLQQFLAWCWEFDVKIVTVWGFSTENAAREEKEVNALMDLLLRLLQKMQTDPLLKERHVNVKIIGQRERFSQAHIEEFRTVENLTRHHRQYHLNLALGYGGRTEIVDSVKKIARSVKDGELEIDAITEDTLSANLYTRGIPDPDLIIRTSGEERLSGFLLWQSAYSELYFTDVYWPAFTRSDFWRAMRSYQQRQRRFGK